MKNYEDVVEEVKNYEDVVEASPGDVSGALIAVHDSDLLDLLILHGSHSAISTVRQCHQYGTSVPSVLYISSPDGKGEGECVRLPGT